MIYTQIYNLIYGICNTVSFREKNLNTWRNLHTGQHLFTMKSYRNHEIYNTFKSLEQICKIWTGLSGPGGRQATLPIQWPCDQTWE